MTIGRPVEGETELHEGLRSAGYEGYVDALRRATIALAAEISGQLVAKCALTARVRSQWHAW